MLGKCFSKLRKKRKIRGIKVFNSHDFHTNQFHIQTHTIVHRLTNDARKWIWYVYSMQHWLLFVIKSFWSIVVMNAPDSLKHHFLFIGNFVIPMLLYIIQWGYRCCVFFFVITQKVNSMKYHVVFGLDFMYTKNSYVRTYYQHTRNVHAHVYISYMRLCIWKEKKKPISYKQTS